jgi:hypothetical protein
VPVHLGAKHPPNGVFLFFIAARGCTMTKFIKSIFPVIPMLIVSSAGLSAQLSGRVFVKNSSGAVHSVPSTLDVSEQISLNIGGQQFSTAEHRITKLSDGREIIYAIFSHLPKGSNQDALILRGVSTVDGGLNGDFFVKQFAMTPEIQDLASTLDSLESQQLVGLNYESSFTFASAERSLPGNVEKVLVARNGTRLVYARLVYDLSDSSKALGCWTNAGVGRNAEYYKGECPVQGSYYWEASANGHVTTAAGFERGVPYSWTRSGQLDAVLVGAERTRAFNEVYLNYSRPNFYGWGFFFLFPW